MRVRTARPHEAFELIIHNGRIASLVPIASDDALPLVLPALVDLQVNGALGIAFTSEDLNVEGVRTVVHWCRSRGTMHLLATIITASDSTVMHGIRTLASAVEIDSDLNQAIAGIHLEGPYLSGEDGPRGAHPPEHIRNPDWDEFRRWQDAAAGRIRMVTIAPERHGAIPFIEQLARSGIIVAIGHTNASAELLDQAVHAGATLSTHLGNGCHAILPRHDNVIWHQLSDDRLMASLIADGHHLPVSVLRAMIRAKQVDRLVMTADTGPLAGLPPGTYPSWGQSFEVLPSGKIVIPGTPYLAGSGSALRDCVQHLLFHRLATESDVEKMASLTPRRFLQLPIPVFSVGSPWKDWTVIPTR
jgi:N-acetylglucosamine-6-phosphate deacetylase